MQIQSEKQLSNLILMVSAILYVLAYFVFYPPIYAFRDEANYFSMAYLLKQGAMFFNPALGPLHNFVEVNGQLTPFYPLGNSIALIPFTFLGWKGVFLYGLVFHGIATWMVFRIAPLLKIEPTIPTLLYLFYPPFIFYSRTLMADIPTTALFLVACYFHLHPQKPKWMAGMFFGMTILFRATNVLLVVPFGICLLIQCLKKQRLKDLFSFVLPMLPFVGFFALCNMIYYGAPWKTGYSVLSPEAGLFSISHLGWQVKHYLINLNLVYPLMFVVFLFSKQLRRPEIILLVGLILVFFCLYNFHDRFPRPWMDFVFGTRFLFAIVPFLILAYGHFLEEQLQKIVPRLRATLLVTLALVLVSGSTFLQEKHQGYLQKQADMKEGLYSVGQKDDTLIYDAHAAELVQQVWGDRHYILYEGHEGLVALLSAQDYRKPVYLATRVIHYDQIEYEGIQKDELKIVRQKFQFDLINQQGDLQVFEITPKS